MEEAANQVEEPCCADAQQPTDSCSPPCPNLDAAEASGPGDEKITLLSSSTRLLDYRFSLTDNLASVPEEDKPSASPPASTANGNTAALFQIVESNASEAGYSGCSMQSECLPRHQLTKTEVLSAKQQVAMWLTRTSMSDLSRLPSLKSLVYQGTSSQTKAKKPASSSLSTSSSVKKAKRVASQANVTLSSWGAGCGDSGPMPIQRNFSTKSLLGNFMFGQRSEQPQPQPQLQPPQQQQQQHQLGPAHQAAIGCCSTSCGPSEVDLLHLLDKPIRKCETTIALSATKPSSSSSTKSGQGLSEQAPKANAAVCLSSTSAKSRTSVKRLYHHQYSAGAFPPQDRALSVASEVESPFQGLRPTNRLRSNSSVICSRCTSVMSINLSRMTSRNASQLSLLHHGNRRRESTQILSVCASDDTTKPTVEPEVFCKICLLEYPHKDVVQLHECNCSFCKECMTQYVNYEVMAGAYDISCPDPDCIKQGVLQLGEIEKLVGKEIFDKHRHFRLNTEVALDANRTWCPEAGCETICHICRPSSSSSAALLAVGVSCPTCDKEFCSLCLSAWHPGVTCEDHGRAMVKHLASVGQNISAPSLSCLYSNAVLPEGANVGDAVIVIDGAEIKRCPMCRVPIERDAGCAQMMCRRCKHVFCWYCLTSLNDDLLLRHYDKGECKGKLGHSRASVFWHRVQAVCIVAGIVLVLLIASPGLLFIAPCLLYRRSKFSGAQNQKDQLEGELNP